MDKKAYPLRLDPAVWEVIARLAASEMRSVNAQIEYLLREALARRGMTQNDPSESREQQG